MTSVFKNAIEIAKHIVEIVKNDPDANFDSVDFNKLDKYMLDSNVQTTKGLIIEKYYGSPYNIITPYGKFKFAYVSSGDFENVIEKLTESIGLQLYREDENVYIGNEFMGVKGGWYTIGHTHDGTPLPRGELATAKQRSYDMTPQIKCISIWTNFCIENNK